MNPWFRFYTEVLDDPKVQKLSDETFKRWVNLLCLACRNDGTLPPDEDVAFALRMSLDDSRLLLKYLAEVKLLDRRRELWTPHNWDERQYKSDVSTERVKRFRKRKRNVSVNVSVKHNVTVGETAPDTDTDTDTDTEQKGGKSALIPEPVLQFGEFKNVLLTESERQKLVSRLNGNLDAFIDRLDRYGKSEPIKFRKYRSHYAVILTWFDRDVKEGKIRIPNDQRTLSVVL